MDLFKIITIIVGVISLILVFIQLIILNKTYKADHERRKKQSTIEYVNSLRKIYKPLEVKLTKLFGQDNVINMKDINDEVREDIRELLSIVENLSTGVNLKVYDCEIINRMSGSYFINLFKRTQPYIDFVRNRDNNDNYYIEFQTMVNDFNSLRQKRNESGVVKHS